MALRLLPYEEQQFPEKVPVDLVVNTARRALYTGHIGDGKIFVYDVRDALKVRTGETGVAALQAVDDIEDVG